jgi:nitrous oxidase accessory protein NosD
VKDFLVTNNSITHCYCGNHLDAWRSDFSERFHYKNATCAECGRKNRVDVRFIGTGHDNWVAARAKKDNFEGLVQQEHSRVTHVVEKEEHGDGHGH